MNEDLGSALELASQEPDARNVKDLIDGMEAELVRSLQSEQAAAILTRHYFNAIRFNPLLRQCTPESLVGALLLSAQCRLEPGPLGHVYLVPFRNTRGKVFEVVWMLGYTGIIELGRRGGANGLRASVVWDCDEYTYPWENEKGVHWTLRHGTPADRGQRVGVLVSWKDGTERMAVHCPPERIATAVSHSKRKDAAELAGHDWYWRKTGVRFARPWLPLTTELATATRLDDGLVSGVDVEAGEAMPEVAEVEHESE